MINKTVGIEEKHEKFLQEHPEINFSGVVRNKIEELIDEKDWEK